jgi:hypothetical protein
MLSLFLALALQAAPPTIDHGQQPRPQRLAPGALLRVDPLFYESAAATGGDFYFWAPGEFARAGLRIPIHDDAVVLVYGKMAQPHRSIAIPVESDARVLTVFAGAQRKDRAVLVRPGGAIVAAGDADATLQTFSHMTIATIRAPAAGTWRLELDGAGLVSVSAHVRPAEGRDAPGFMGFDFVRMGGRPGHEGWFPIEGPVRAGQTLDCRAEVFGDATDVKVSFVAPDGQAIAVQSMPVEDPDYGVQYVGRCKVPDRPFRVVVTGRDRRGQAFRRIESALRTPR